jgi:hypothetical protein
MNTNPVGGPPGGPDAQGGTPWNSSKYSAKVFFCYETDIAATLAAQASVPLTFNVAGDSDFFWTKFTAFAQVGGSSGTSGTATTYSAQQLPSVTALIINTTTGRQYSSTAVPLPNMAGTAQFPFILPMITLWPRKSTIQIQLLNNGSVSYTTLQLSFLGIKAFTNSTNQN